MINLKRLQLLTMFLETKTKRNSTIKCANTPRQASSTKVEEGLRTPGVHTEALMAMMKALEGQVQVLIGSQMHIKGSNSMRKTMIRDRNNKVNTHIIAQKMAKNITTTQKEHLEETLMTSSMISSAGRRRYSGKEWKAKKRRA